LGFLDVVFGRKRLKEASDERLFALSTAQVTLEIELGLKPAGAAAVVFKPLSAGEFTRVEAELGSLLETVAQSCGARVENRTDELGFQWLIVHDPDLEDQVTATHLIGSELKARGFGPQLLAALFKFVDDGKPVFLIYGYKRGAWWPFVPTGDGKDRDNAAELALKAKLEKELPIEQDLTRWLALFDAPL
jgi:hypothetical protein